MKKMQEMNAYELFLSGVQPYLNPKEIADLRGALDHEYKELAKFGDAMRQAKAKDPTAVDNSEVYLRYASDIHFAIETYLDSIQLIEMNQLDEDVAKHYARVMGYYHQFKGMLSLTTPQNLYLQYLLGNWPEVEVIDDRAAFIFPTRGKFASVFTVAPWPVLLLLGPLSETLIERYAMSIVANDNLEVFYSCMNNDDMARWSGGDESIPFRSTLLNLIIGNPGPIDRFNCSRMDGDAVTTLSTLFKKLSEVYAKEGTIFAQSPANQQLCDLIFKSRNEHRRKVGAFFYDRFRKVGYI